MQVTFTEFKLVFVTHLTNNISVLIGKRGCPESKIFGHPLFVFLYLSFTILYMKILQISSAKNFGGGEKHFIDLCRGLDKRGHKVFVVLRPTCEWRERLDFLPNENFRSVSIRNSFGIFSAQKISKFIRKHNIEIVHAHVARDYFPASLACRIAKTPKFILTRHVLFPMKAFYKFALNNLSTAIAVSNAVAKNLRILFPKEKVVVVSNGIEVENWTDTTKINFRKEFRIENNIPLDAQFIGTVGELKTLKGQEDFILAANIIAQKFPKSHFAIIGKDNSFDQSFRRKLKRLVKVFGLGDRVLWLDWVEDTTKLFSALDIFVSASHSESFGLAILEAMASATPIVATETEGAKELLNNGETGLLVPINEPVKLSEAINQMLLDNNLRIQLGEKAKINAKERFGLQKMIDKTEKIYDELGNP